MAKRLPLAGVCPWMLAAPSYPDYDHYTLYYNGEPLQRDAGQGETGRQVTFIKPSFTNERRPFLLG